MLHAHKNVRVLQLCYKYFCKFTGNDYTYNLYFFLVWAKEHYSACAPNHRRNYLHRHTLLFLGYFS